MKNEETGIVIPFWGGFIFPLKKIDQNAKAFFMLVSIFACLSAMVSMFLGRGFACGLGGADKMFYCANNISGLIANVLVLLFLTALFIHRWWLLCFANKSFAEVIKKRVGLKDLKVVGFVFLFLALWLFVGGGFYVLYVRKATPNLNFELAWFIFVSAFILGAVFLLVNFVVFARFLDGKKWFLLNKTAWPIFDNIYKLMGWVLVYLLFFAYFIRQIGRAFFTLQTVLPVWLASFIGDFSLYFIFYFMIVCFVLLLKYQELHIFADENN